MAKDDRSWPPTVAELRKQYGITDEYLKGNPFRASLLASITDEHLKKNPLLAINFMSRPQPIEQGSEGVMADPSERKLVRGELTDIYGKKVTSWRLWPPDFSSGIYLVVEPTNLGTEIGKDTSVTLNNDDRRKGLYLLGKAGMGKTTLMTNIILRDIKEGHGVFFLDPHGDAITDILKRTTIPVFVINPQDETHSFGINILACKNISSMTEQVDTYTRAHGVFQKLWADEKGVLSPWLQLIIENTIYVFIENQEYTLAEVPRFLVSPPFREKLLANVKHNTEVVDFWQYRFGGKRERDQEAQIDAALTRVCTLLGHPYIKDIVGQRQTTLNFSEIIEKKQVVLVKLSANLPEDIKRFIGIILLNELLFAVRKRIEIPEEKRHQFCIFVDEFQNFANAEDFSLLFTEARKFGIATTIAHQERFGQFAGNKKIQGATLASANKVAFQLTPLDAAELASEFAMPPPTETKLEPERPLSLNPFWDLANYGHGNPTIQAFVTKKILWITGMIDMYKPKIELAQAKRAQYQEEAAYYRDASGMHNIEGRQARFERDMPSAERYALSSESAARQRLFSIHEKMQQAATDIRHYTGQMTVYQEFAQIADTHLYAVMDGSITVDLRCEHLARLILALNSYPYNFYTELRFGDPKIPRRCPADIAYKCFPRELEAEHMKEQRKQWSDHSTGESRIRQIEASELYSKDYKLNWRRDQILKHAEGILREYSDRKEQEALAYYRKPGNIIFDVHGAYIRLENPLLDHIPKLRIDKLRLPDLPPRMFSDAERAKIFAAYAELNPQLVKDVDEIVEFLRLIARPENRVRVVSHHHTERTTNTRTHKDMADEAAHELVALPPFTAYVKTDGKYKVKTAPLPNPTEERSMQEVLEYTHTHCCTEREAIKAEMKRRRGSWQGGGKPPPPSSS